MSHGLGEVTMKKNSYTAGVRKKKKKISPSGWKKKKKVSRGNEIWGGQRRFETLEEKSSEKRVQK